VGEELLAEAILIQIHRKSFRCRGVNVALKSRSAEGEVRKKAEWSSFVSMPSGIDFSLFVLLPFSAILQPYLSGLVVCLPMALSVNFLLP
jgi:hypothetical protein